MELAFPPFSIRTPISCAESLGFVVVQSPKMFSSVMVSTESESLSLLAEELP